MFSDEALAQIARYYRLAGARRCHEEGLAVPAASSPSTCSTAVRWNWCRTMPEILS